MTKNGLEIGYAPVLAFVDVNNPSDWRPLVVLEGEPQLRDCFVERVLLPGEFLTDEQCADMKQRYAEAYPVEVRLQKKQPDEIRA